MGARSTKWETLEKKNTCNNQKKHVPGPFLTERLLMGRKESNQSNKQNQLEV